MGVAIHYTNYTLAKHFFCATYLTDFFCGDSFGSWCICLSSCLVSVFLNRKLLELWWTSFSFAVKFLNGMFNAFRSIHFLLEECSLFVCEHLAAGCGFSLGTHPTHPLELGCRPRHPVWTTSCGENQLQAFYIQSWEIRPSPQFSGYDSLLGVVMTLLDPKSMRGTNHLLTWKSGAVGFAVQISFQWCHVVCSFRWISDVLFFLWLQLVQFSRIHVHVMFEFVERMMFLRFAETSRPRPPSAQQV